MTELTKKLADVQTKLKAKKSSYNSFGKYYFRKAEDILEGIKPFLLQHNIYVTVSEELIATDPVPMIQTTATISDGKDSIHATAVACIAFLPSLIVAVVCIIGIGSAAISSSDTVT